MENFAVRQKGKREMPGGDTQLDDWEHRKAKEWPGGMPKGNWKTQRHTKKHMEKSETERKAKQKTLSRFAPNACNGA